MKYVVVKGLVHTYRTETELRAILADLQKEDEQ